MKAVPVKGMAFFKGLMKKNILIIGDEIDPHIIEVCKYLKKYNGDFILLNPANGEHAAVTYTYSPFSIFFSDSTRTINHSEISAVWWRLKPNVRRIPGDVDEMRTEAFINREWQMSLEPLSFFLKDCFWINKRSSDYLIRNKPYQIHLAKASGFETPESVISNNVDFILERLDKFDDPLYKPLSYFINPPGRLLFANKMTKHQVESCRANIALAPCIFQNYIEKAFELRITVIRDFVYAIKIYSQESDTARHDWRRSQFDLKYESVTLEKEFEEKLLKFHHSIDIVFGAYDFIVDTEGNYVFLEVNPAGQWLWLEKILHMNISEMLAAVLLQKEGEIFVEERPHSD